MNVGDERILCLMSQCDFLVCLLKVMVRFSAVHLLLVYT